jgi:hypothetical protein
MPINITAAGATGTHSFTKTNVNLEDNFFYFTGREGDTVVYPTVLVEGNPRIFRNATGSITGPTNNGLNYIKKLDDFSFSLSETSGGTAIDLTALTNGTVRLDFPTVFNNLINVEANFADQQMVKYYTSGSSITGLTSGATYYLKSSNSGLAGASLYTFTEHTFTSAGQTGRFGPTKAQMDTAYSASAYASANIVQGAFQGYQDWTVPISGIYEITAAGARGYNGRDTGGTWVPGQGAIVKGRVQLFKGEIITVAVGQIGELQRTNSDTAWVGGGGGTFVVRKNGNVPLFVAGGGSADGHGRSGQNGQLTINGGAGSQGAAGGVNGQAGSTNGQGGAPGGGFFSAGATTDSGTGGGSFANGLTQGNPILTYGGNGGFGGGSQADGDRYGQGGAGGGYSGGGGGNGTASQQAGGGGGSYIFPSATNVATSTGLFEGVATFNNSSITNLNAFRNDNGQAIITLISQSGSGYSVHTTAAAAAAGTGAITLTPAGNAFHALVPITLDLENNNISTTSPHGLNNGEPLVPSFTGTAPSPLVAGTIYYVNKVNDYTYKLSLNVDLSTDVDFTTPGSSTNFAFGKVVVNTALDRITINSHGFQVNQPIRYQTNSGNAIPPLQNNATYYVKTVIDNNTIQLSQSLGGPVIDLGSGGSSVGTGTGHSFIYVVVNLEEDSLYIPGHDLVTGSRVVYGSGSGTAIGGLSNGTSYFAVRVDNNIVKLSTNKEGTALVNLTSLGSGNHTLTTNQLNLTDNQISIPAHGFSRGELVQYDSVGQTAVGGLSSGSPYYIILVDGDNIKLATTLENANANVAVDLTQVGVGVHRILSLSKSPDGTYTVNSVPNTENPTTFTVPANGFVPNIEKVFTPRSVLDIQQNNLRILSHGFGTGTAVTYGTAGGTAIGGLANTTVYYVINVSKDHIQLASSVENASSGVPIALTTFGAGTDHTLTSSQINGYVTGTGTVSTASGSTLVSGSNTSFAKILKVGDTFRLYPPNVTTTVTFASSAVAVNTANTITSTNHLFTTGDSVVYTAGIGSVAPTGLTSTFFYFVRRVDSNTIALYNTSADAVNNTNRVVITTQGSGTTHTLVRTIPSAPILRKITAIGSDTQVTVNRPYATAYSSVSYAYQTFVYVRPQGYSLHRPFDGGVEMSVGVGTSNASIIRQTRKYFRYQSGKGLQTSAGINFKPTIDLEKVVRESATTFTATCRRPHGLINGLTVRISEALTSTGAVSTIYNGAFQVTVLDSLRFTCIATSTIPQGAEAKAYGFPQFNVDTWTNGALRSGMFDFQNGMFFEFDGQKMYAVRRSSTQQIAGTAAAQQGSEFIFGTGTTFTTQLTVNDYIVMRGQSYKVTSILSDTRITVKPEYKGSSGIEKEFNPGNGTTGVVRLDTDEFVIQNHGFVDSLPVVYDSIDGSPIGGLINGRTYYVHLVDNNTFALKATPDAVSDVSISSVGVGTPHSFTPAKSGIIMTKTVDTRVPQENWSIDPCDGTGPTGFNLDLNRIQMIYIDYSWYGAGKIRFGFKDQTGEVKYVHEFIHNNILLESYFRSGNLPARYEVTTYNDPTYIPFLFHWGTSVIMDGKFDDDKAYLFSGSSQTLTITGTTAKNFGSRAITLATDVINIPSHGFTTGDGVQFVGLTPQGLTGFNNQNPATTNNASNPFANLQNSRVYYVRTVDANNITLHPTSADALATGGTNRIDITSQGNSQYTFNLFPLGSLNNTSGANYQPLLSLRLSPSVSEGLTGKLGDRDVINRMQLRTKELAVATTQLVDVKVLINPRLNNLNFVSVPSPSLTQIIAHTANDTVSGGVQVYNFRAAGQGGAEQSTTVSLDELFELSNSILGGDSVYPDGPDILTIAVSRLTGSTTLASAKLTWTEAQA